MGSSTISPYFTIPRLQLRIASTTHYTISWTSCQRTWTSHHTNLTLAEPHIKLLYANLTLPRPRKVQTWHIHKLHATSASHNLPLMLRQPLTSHCTNLTFHQPRIQYVNSTGPEPHITLTAHCLSSTRRELHIIRRITLHQFQLHNCLNLMYPNPTLFHNSWCFANRRWQIALELRHQRRNLIVCWNLCETPCFVEYVSMIVREKISCAPGSGSLAVVPTRSWRFEMHAQWNSGLKMTFVSLRLCCAMAFWQGAELLSALELLRQGYFLSP